ncbi:conjugal transfer protein TraF [Leclercia adecarboxylata]|uniref:conjugal transfer protein TraF n=1 Tax=Leclercia adecarboxylata TaxID=83655 RepID=UPI0013DF07FA|nr:conjugal transfer protein TraF [Leclercia adecarboxylata]MDU1654101.1 conjugal transfer protein TraF [Leclercia adecarboxylata]MDU2019863.1 conjugal transfer protein TraF [Leclercia adecarboxylata]QIG26985.1 conjugal transfer protein TraF [Leclercia adecarboxylata]
MKIKFKFSVAGIATAFLLSNQAGAANTWTEARGDAMGGTGVASAHYSSGVLINPALLAKSQAEDDVAIIFPSVGAQISDQDNLQDKIDEISDEIRADQEMIDDLTVARIMADPQGTLSELQGAAGSLADQLEFLEGKTAHGNAGAGIAVSIPGSGLSLAFVAKANAHARVSSEIDQQDIDFLRRLQGSMGMTNQMALGAARNGSDVITRNLNSIAKGRAAIVSDYGVAIARQFDFNGLPVSVGVTPKLQQTWLYNYTTSIYTYDSSDFNSSRYRNDDTSFNVDVGVAVDFGENWTVGLSGQNLLSRDIDTNDIRVLNGRTGQEVSYQDTWQIRPLVTAGVAWHTGLLTLSADGDLTQTRGFKSEENSQYVGAGAEVSLLGWLAVRGGFRSDVKGNDSNVFTGGLGFAPFNTVHIDLTGIVGEDETWGAGAQFSVRF